MLQKVSNVDFKSARQSKNNAAKKENKTVSAPLQNSNSLPNLKNEHLKANFALNFRGKYPEPPKPPTPPEPPKKPVTAIVKFSDVNPSQAKSSTKPLFEGVVKTVSDQPTHLFKESSYYNETVNSLVIELGANKNVLMPQEEGVDEDLMLRKFVGNIKEGNYERNGLPKDTKVHIFDAVDLLRDKIKPGQVIATLSKQSDERQVVFIKNFVAFVNETKDGLADPVDYFSRALDNKVHMVGLLSKEDYEKIANPSKGPFDVPPVKPELISRMTKVDFDGLTPQDTKKLLKEDARYTIRVLNRYKGQKLQVSPQAIDEIVDKSASSLKGAFPDKALRVLDLIAAAKLADYPHGEAKKASRDNKITTADVKRFFADHNDLLATLKPTKGQFMVAENVKTKLSDVGGIKSIKEILQDGILAYIKDPKKYTATGQPAPKGIILHSTPGTGKTLLARAIAGESKTPFIAASGSEFVEQYVGVGPKRVRELFAAAHKAAAASENKTAIIFIDEIDAIGGKRTGGSGGSQEREATLNQLLTEMDGFNNKESKTKVIVIAATNRLDILDDALTRPGRFDDKVEVPSAANDEEARREILEIHAKKKNFDTAEAKAKVLEGAAKITEGMSGAEIAGLMTKAAKVAGKRPENNKITYDDIVEGYLQTVAGPITPGNDGKNKEMCATIVRHEGGHAILIDTLSALPNYKEKIAFITLDPRGDFLGAVFHHKATKSLSNFESAIASAAVSYAGGLAEPGYSKDGHSGGVSSDFRNVHKVITNSIKTWGLGINTPQMAIPEGSPEEKMYEAEIKKDIAIFSNASQKIAKLVIEFHKPFLDEYVENYKANAGKGGNNLSGEAFSQMRQEWLQKTGKDKQVPALMKEITGIIESARQTQPEQEGFTGKIAAALGLLAGGAVAATANAKPTIEKAGTAAKNAFRAAMTRR